VAVACDEGFSRVTASKDKLNASVWGEGAFFRSRKAMAYLSLVLNPLGKFVVRSSV
jgi:hypothetical protein